MQATFTSLWRQLIGEIPILPESAAQKFISNAWVRVQQAREWSWRHRDGMVLFPAQIATGTISVTKNLRTVALDATALAAWNADTSLPLIGSRQLRFPGTVNRIYGITNFNAGTGEITLDKLYTGATNTASTYSLYSAYVAPMTQLGEAEPFFEKFISLRAITTGSTLWAPAKITTLQLDRIDFGRQFYGVPRNFAWVKTQDVGTILPYSQRLEWFEFWPHCTFDLQYETRYLRKPVSFEDDPTQVLPAHLNETVVIYAALMEAYRWAESNRGSDQRLSGTNWGLKLANLSSLYPTNGDSYFSLLRAAELEDDSYINQTMIAEQRQNTNLSAIPITTLVQPS